MGPIQNPRLCFYKDEKGLLCYSWQIYFKPIDNCPYGIDVHNVVERYLEELCPLSGFLICPGIKHYPDIIRFKTKKLMESGPPFVRKFATNCWLWHQPKNDYHRITQDHPYFNCCKECKLLQHDINTLEKRAEKTPKSQRDARVSSSSKYPLSQLSPASQQVRRSRIAQERRQFHTKIKRTELKDYDYDLNGEQHDEMLQAVKQIRGSAAIEQLIKEGEKALGSDNNVLKDAWHQDVVERLQYEEDQKLSGVYYLHVDRY